MHITPNTREEESALAWMQATELARNSTLLQSAVTAVTTISQPARVQHEGTAWSRRQRLLSDGWSESTSGRDASSRCLVLNPCQSNEYFGLLADHLAAVRFLEETGKFSHAQGVHYYTTIKAMVSHANFRSHVAARLEIIFCPLFLATTSQLLTLSSLGSRYRMSGIGYRPA